MARYRRRYRTIVRAPRKKWASNYTDFTISPIEPTANISASSTMLVQNAAQSNSPTPVIVKTGNFRVEGELSLTNSTVHVRAVAYVIYVPEGTEPNSATSAQNIVRNHPEWIMACKMIDTPSPAAADTSGVKFVMSSRLKRNLNSGDKILLLMVLQVNPLNPDDHSPVPGWSGVGYARYWTCAN